MPSVPNHPENNCTNPSILATIQVLPRLTTLRTKNSTTDHFQVSAVKQTTYTAWKVYQDILVKVADQQQPDNEDPLITHDQRRWDVPSQLSSNYHGYLNLTGTNNQTKVYRWDLNNGTCFS